MREPARTFSAEAAAKLGAGKVYASIGYPEAVEVARENFDRAGVEVELATGSADRYAAQSADLVVANISPASIRDLASELVRTLEPGAIAVLSGFEAAMFRRYRQRCWGAGEKVASNSARRSGECWRSRFRTIRAALRVLWLPASQPLWRRSARGRDPPPAARPAYRR